MPLELKVGHDKKEESLVLEVKQDYEGDVQVSLGPHFVGYFTEEDGELSFYPVGGYEWGKDGKLRLNLDGFDD